MTNSSALSALRSLTDALGASATDDDLSRIFPLVTRLLERELHSGPPLPDLGETEPAFGLRFDVNAERVEEDAA